MQPARPSCSQASKRALIRRRPQHLPSAPNANSFGASRISAPSFISPHFSPAPASPSHRWLGAAPLPWLESAQAPSAGSAVQRSPGSRAGSRAGSRGTSVHFSGSYLQLHHLPPPRSSCRCSLQLCRHRHAAPGPAPSCCCSAPAPPPPGVMTARRTGGGSGSPSQTGSGREAGWGASAYSSVSGRCAGAVPPASAAGVGMQLLAPREQKQ